MAIWNGVWISVSSYELRVFRCEFPVASYEFPVSAGDGKAEGVFGAGLGGFGGVGEALDEGAEFADAGVGLLDGESASPLCRWEAGIFVLSGYWSRTWS